MPININASNYINTQTAGSNGASAMNQSVNNVSDGAIVSVKGLDLQVGQTLSGQIVEIDGKDIKLLLSNNQTINARLEGNINALLGQTLSFEVKNSDNGQTALRPLYTNLNNSQTVTNALQNAGLPVTDNYAKMVSSMMDESMPINKNAIYSMAKQINTFPNANPDTVVKLNKLGLQVNELTINQYENYKGLEHKIMGDVDNLSKGLSDLMRDSLAEVKSPNADIELLKAQTEANTEQNVRPDGKSLLTAFFNALTGAESESSNNVKEEVFTNTNGEEIAEAIEGDEAANSKEIPKESFDTSKLILDMVDTNEMDSEENVSEPLKDLTKGLIDSLKSDVINAEAEEPDIAAKEAANKANNTRESIISELLAKSENGISKQGQVTFEDNVKRLIDNLENKENITDKDTVDLVKNILKLLDDSPEKVPNAVKSKLADFMSNKEFGDIVKNGINKQMLLKPEEVVNSKNIDDLYAKITKQAMQAVEILENSGKDNPQLLNAAKNISDNVSFMNELNQVVTYIQLPLLMNNQSAHGDLYVYTNKKSLKNNDGNISALLHLDMDNLGPMDIYVALTNNTKLNTHFYLQDEATIDFIEAHIDALNKRLIEKGYDMNVDVSVKDALKGPTNMAEEFMKDDPSQNTVSASKFSFDVRA